MDKTKKVSNNGEVFLFCLVEYVSFFFFFYLDKVDNSYLSSSKYTWFCSKVQEEKACQNGQVSAVKYSLDIIKIIFVNDQKDVFHIVVPGEGSMSQAKFGKVLSTFGNSLNLKK